MYKTGLEDNIAQAKRTGARVILYPPTVVGEKKNSANRLDAQLDDYAGISRRVAYNLNIELCDLRIAFVSYLQVHNPHNVEKGILAVDRAHLNAAGNLLVAQEMLKVLEK